LANHGRERNEILNVIIQFRLLLTSYCLTFLCFNGNYYLGIIKLIRIH